MRITVTARHLKVTDKVKDYAREKLKKLERYFDRISNIYVILDEEGTDKICEVNISTETNNLGHRPQPGRHPRGHRPVRGQGAPAGPQAEGKDQGPQGA